MGEAESPHEDCERRRATSSKAPKKALRTSGFSKNSSFNVQRLLRESDGGPDDDAEAVGEVAERSVVVRRMAPQAGVPHAHVAGGLSESTLIHSPAEFGSGTFP